MQGKYLQLKIRCFLIFGGEIVKLTHPKIKKKYNKYQIYYNSTKILYTRGTELEKLLIITKLCTFSSKLYHAKFNY